MYKITKVIRNYTSNASTILHKLKAKLRNIKKVCNFPLYMYENVIHRVKITTRVIF